MGVRLPTSAVVLASGSVVNTTVETVFITSQPLNLSLAFQQVLILFWVTFTVGASATACQLRIRRGSLTGAAINLNVTTKAVTAGVQDTISGVYADTPGDVAAQQYVLTLQFTAATANSGINDACIALLAL